MSNAEQPGSSFEFPTNPNEALLVVLQAATCLTKLSVASEGAGRTGEFLAQLSTHGIPSSGIGMAGVQEFLAGLVHESMNWYAPEAVLAPSAPVAPSALLGCMVAVACSANLAKREFDPAFLLSERFLVDWLIDLVGFDPSKAGGTTSTGGQQGIIYALRAAVHSATARGGKPLTFFRSAGAHFSLLNAVGILNLDRAGIQEVGRTNGRMSAIDLRKRMEASIQSGRDLTCVVIEFGSTVDFAIDPVGEILAVIESIATQYNLPLPYVVVDGTIGGLYKVFDKYDFDNNPLRFNRRTLDSLLEIRDATASLALVDAVVVSFHKLGFAPITSAFSLFKNAQDLLITHRPEVEANEPNNFLFEASRGAIAPIAALCNVLTFGVSGYQKLFGRNVHLRARFVDGVKEIIGFQVLNYHCPGPAFVIRYVGADEDSLHRASALTEELYFRVSQAPVAECGLRFSLLRDYKLTADGQIDVPTAVLKGYFISPSTSDVDVDRSLGYLARFAADN